MSAPLLPARTVCTPALAVVVVVVEAGVEVEEVVVGLLFGGGPYWASVRGMVERRMGRRRCMAESGEGQ